MKTSMHVEGLAELEAKLNALPAAGSKRAMRSALMYAITPWKDAAVEKVAEQFGDLKNAIVKRSFINKKNDFKADAGIVMNTKKKAAGWRWHFEEFGTSTQKARPFLRSAFDANQQIVIERFVKKIKKQIAVELAKAKK